MVVSAFAADRAAVGASGYYSLFTYLLLSSEVIVPFIRADHLNLQCAVNHSRPSAPCFLLAIQGLTTSSSFRVETR